VFPTDDVLSSLPAFHAAVSLEIGSALASAHPALVGLALLGCPPEIARLLIQVVLAFVICNIFCLVVCSSERSVKEGASALLFALRWYTASIPTFPKLSS
jgi:hypothetical protein